MVTVLLTSLQAQLKANPRPCGAGCALSPVLISGPA